MMKSTNKIKKPKVKLITSMMKNKTQRCSWSSIVVTLRKLKWMLFLLSLRHQLHLKMLLFLSDNASDIHKALEKFGKFKWLGCAGHHTNLIAQVDFKNVVTAARLVRKCKKIVEHIKHSTNSTNLLIEYENILKLPLLKVLQENNTRWWSILILVDSFILIIEAVLAVLAKK